MSCYEGTGSKRHRRDTLPQPDQEAYMVNESLAANELERSVRGLSGETQEEVNNQITGISAIAGEADGGVVALVRG